MSEKRTTCIVCGGQLDGDSLLKLEDMPASAQNIPDENQVGEDHGITLWLHQCPHCGLVQFDCEPVDYYRDVIRSGGFSTTMVELRRRQYSHFIEFCGLEGKKIIEAGCGRGEFLSVLAQFPVSACGIEHREDLVEIAAKDGLNVWKGFTESEDMDLRGPSCQPPYDAFLSFNFLEHQPDPVTMLRCIYHNLTDDGVGLITVPSLEYILQFDGYYELIRDHLAYYTFDTLGNLLNICGFEVLEEEMVNRDTLSVIVRKIPDFVPGKTHEEREMTCSPVDVTGLRNSRRTITDEVNGLASRLHDQGKTLAVWGASHQGFTLAATTKLGDRVSYIIDSAPFKQGRFAPASHLPIVSPDYVTDHPVDAILIVAPGYTDEIAAIIRQRYGVEVEILTLRSNHIERL